MLEKGNIYDRPYLHHIYARSELSTKMPTTMVCENTPLILYNI